MRLRSRPPAAVLRRRAVRGRARDLDLDLDEEEEVFDRLDGFSVDVSIEDSVAGPFELGELPPHSRRRGPYRVVADGATTAGKLAEAGLEAVDCPENRSPT